MKKRLIYGIVLSLSMLTTSCSISRQAATNVNVAQTEVVLAHNNYKVIGTVEGVSTQNYIFGIGGMSKESMKSSALNEMYRQADMNGKSRAVINVNVVYKNKYIILYHQATCIATGTLIEFTD